ncbi:MAG TPA: hypothetical protein VFV63_11250 [Ilumatobacteraceae bacterium]|nr:hypothetical protein [Ilumatobacteraceae bacterium]
MKRHTTPLRHPLVAVASVLALGLSACGDDTESSPATGPTTADTLPPVDTAPPDTGGDGIEHPTGPDDVVLRIGYEGGFVPVDYAFLNLPILLVTGDGRVIVQGPQIEIYPGPLLPNVQQRTISEAGIQALLRLADEHDLFRDVTYQDDTNIADAPYTVVTLSANGDTYEHEAYALGLGGDGTEPDEERARLASFVEQASDIVTAAGADTLGPEEPFEAASYLIRATVADPSSLDQDIPPTLVDWPADAPVRLADAAECATVPADSFRDLFASATQLTWFVDAGITYQLTVKPQLPGVPAC